MSRETILEEVDNERRRQISKWGADNDETQTVWQFVQYIEDYAAWARMMANMKSMDKARNRLIQVAALAVAAVEQIDKRDVRE